MTSSTASVTSTDHGIDVRGHRPPRDDAAWRGDTEQTPDTLFPTCTADGAIAATPDDMAHYLRFLLNGGAEGVLGADDFALLSGRHTPADDGWYGYGLGTDEDPDQTRLGHSGGMVGMFADVQVDRDRGIGSCLLVNGYADVSQANLHVLRQLCDLPTTSETWPRPEQRDDGADHPLPGSSGPLPLLQPVAADPAGRPRRRRAAAGRSGHRWLRGAAPGVGDPLPRRTRRLTRRRDRRCRWSMAATSGSTCPAACTVGPVGIRSTPPDGSGEREWGLGVTGRRSARTRPGARSVRPRRGCGAQHSMRRLRDRSRGSRTRPAADRRRSVRPERPRPSPRS